jgi:alpha-ketoglutarate-dependent taurine dioxygenase
MSVTVRPFAAGLGADISGVDIREPLSTADRTAIRAAWLANLVLRFRGQPMTDEQHLAFTRQFGELEFIPAALIAKQYGVETQTARPQARNTTGNLGRLRHHRRRQGDRRPRRRRDVLAHRQLVC